MFLALCTIGATCVSTAFVALYASPHSSDVHVCSFTRSDLHMLAGVVCVTQDSHKSTSVTCLCHLVGGMLAVGTNIGRIMICSANSVLSVHDISPAGSGQGTSSAGTPTAAEDTVSHSGSIRSRSLCGAVLASGTSSPASSPKRGKPSLVAPWQEVLKDVSKGSQPAAAAYAVQALVQCGRGFVAVGSVGDIYLFNPAGGRGCVTASLVPLFRTSWGSLRKQQLEQIVYVGLQPRSGTSDRGKPTSVTVHAEATVSDPCNPSAHWLLALAGMCLRL